MSTPEIVFGSLDDVPLREAWAHEAHRFTPWLAENLDRLEKAIGIPLELTGTEMRVGPFSADILAKNASDDSTVLIENQLEGSDHTHLGQIMTYLAGLEAHTMIWVAPDFRDEHLSAIRWLNQHTVDPFAFFAVRLRVVRIADSPFAPLFEVIERPNNWDRQVASVKRTNEGEMSELGQFRLSFWTHFCEAYPEEGAPDGASSRWKELPGTTGVLVQYLAKTQVGVFVRPERGQDAEALREELEPIASDISQSVGAEIGDGKYLFSKSFAADTRDEANWPAMSRWLHEQAELYTRAFASAVGGES